MSLITVLYKQLLIWCERVYCSINITVLYKQLLIWCERLYCSINITVLYKQLLIWCERVYCSINIFSLRQCLARSGLVTTTPKNIHLIEVSDLADLWVIKIKSHDPLRA